MAEEAKDSPPKGRPRRPPCEFPEGALDLLKQLTEGKLSAWKGSGMMTWDEVVRVMNENFTPVNKMLCPSSEKKNRPRLDLLCLSGNQGFVCFAMHT